MSLFRKTSLFFFLFLVSSSFAAEESAKDKKISPRLQNRSLLSSSFKLRTRNDGRTQVYVRLKEVGKANLAALETTGFVLETSLPAYRLVQGTIPDTKIKNLAALDCVLTVFPPAQAKTRKGSVTTEGDSILRTDDVRTETSYTGSGVKVGVISDGVDGLFDSVSSGDLPGGSDTTCDPDGTQKSGVHCQTFSNLGIAATGFSEGSAMLEIIHDMATNADLYFVNPDTAADMVDAINYLASTAKVDVIVDDLGFLDEPFFEDGMVADAAQAAADAGIVYVSAAGNDAENHLQEAFVDSDGDNFHNFQGALANPDFYSLTIGPGDELEFILQWDDPFDGSGTNTVNFTLDVYSDQTRLILVESEAGTEIEPNVPLKDLVYTNTSSNTRFGSLTIEAPNGKPNNWEIILVGGLSFSDLDGPFVTMGDSIYGHPAASGALAIGAVSADDPGNDTIESFSSQGPVTITGEATQRSKPDFTGIDNVSVTGNGGFVNPFPGTSASAPGVTACVAMLLEANPDFTPTQVRDTLSTTSTDLGDAGFDNVYGYGLVDCRAAMQRMSDQGQVTQEPQGDADDGSTSGGGCSLTPSRPTANGILVLLLMPLLVIFSVRTNEAIQFPQHAQEIFLKYSMAFRF